MEGPGIIHFLESSWKWKTTSWVGGFHGHPKSGPAAFCTLAHDDSQGVYQVLSVFGVLGNKFTIGLMNIHIHPLNHLHGFHLYVVIQSDRCGINAVSREVKQTVSLWVQDGPGTSSGCPLAPKTFIWKYFHLQNHPQKVPGPYGSM